MDKRIEHLQKIIHQQQEEIYELKQKKYARFANEECWIYQGNNSDHLESLVCPVVISAEKLIELITSQPGNGANRATSTMHEWNIDYLLDLNKRLLQNGFSFQHQDYFKLREIIPEMICHLCKHGDKNDGECFTCSGNSRFDLINIR